MSGGAMGVAPPPTLEDVAALLVDLDGVLTKTAVVHAAAWKQLFDEFFAGSPGTRAYGALVTRGMRRGPDPPSNPEGS
jgi:hypothetical protein